MATLYRTYRPKTFDEVIGQNHIKVTLQNEISTGKIAHAYLFSGPRGVGKTTVARLFAKAVNCEKRKSKTAEPCNDCPACTEIIGNQAVDLIEIDAASHTGVDNVRENIIQNARFTPTKRKVKIFIIDEVHMLSTAAFNALLKILEEPPEHVIFVLATTEIHKVPETIISRCQRFDFRRIPYGELLERLQTIIDLENIKVDESILKTIVRLSEGSARDAESLLGQVLTLGDKEITEDMAKLVLPHSNVESALTFIEHLEHRDASAAIQLIHSIEDEGVDLVQFNRDVIDLLRQSLLSKVIGGLNIVSHTEQDPELLKRLDEATDTLPVSELTSMLSRFIHTERELKLTDLPTLPLELVIIDLCGSGESDNEPPPSKAEKPAQTTIAPKKAAPKKTTPGVMSITSVQKQWSAVVKTVRSINQSLSLTLNVSEPVKLEGDELVLRVDYAFHADRLKERKNAQLIMNAIQEVTKKPLKISTVVERVERQARPEAKTKKAVPKSAESDGLIEGLVETFGGSVSD